jgi:hypothetical protein
MFLLFTLSMMAQTTAPPSPKPDAKAGACCADKAKCEACCKSGCKDCKECKGGATCCCKSNDGKVACTRDKDGKMSCCEGMKDGKMANDGCCGGKCDRMAHEKKAGM